MARTDVMRTHHSEIANLVTQISDCLKPEEIRQKGEHIRSLLTLLSVKLTVHLAMEDKSLYPQMLASSSDEAKKMAAEFMKEMGGIAEALKAYLTKWPSGAVISGNAGEFCTATTGLFQVLMARITREEAKLYPLADKL